MRIAIATDAWFPQVNGVVRTLSTTVKHLKARGWEVLMVTPDRFLTVPMPGYASIPLAVAPWLGMRRMLDAFAPDLVHISTEGPLGWAARGWCLSRGVPHTTAFHTRFPEYAEARTGISAERFWPFMRRFHRHSRAVLTATRSLSDELNGRGIVRTRPWSRGIDHALFRPEGERHRSMTALPGPVLLNVGRVATEKNLEAFLDAPVEGASKVVVGDGPALEDLKRRYPQVTFLGALSGEALASAYRAADCFVFPSLTDTFGLVVIEALACGVPVAAYPVTGPIDILGSAGLGVDGDLPAPAGALGYDLTAAIVQALTARREDAARLGARFSWAKATDQFANALQGAVIDEHRELAVPA